MTDKERAIAVFKGKIEWEKEKRYPFISDEEVKACKLSIQIIEQTTWISMSDRMPEEKQDVLACFYNGNGDYKLMVTYRTDYNYWKGVGRTGDMVAWMPLPPWYVPQESEVSNEQR